MKKLAISLMGIFLLLFPATAYASGDNFVVDGVTYCMTADGNAAVGDGEHPAIHDTVTQLTIPSSVEHLGKQYPVTQISAKAFFNCKNLTSLSLPVTLTDIGHRSLQGTSLSQIEADPDNPLFYVEDGILFERVDNAYRLYCVGTTMYCETFGPRQILWYYPKGKRQNQYIVPEDVYMIGDGAFEGAQIKHIQLPDNVIDIGIRTFADSAVESVCLPDDLATIPEETFAGSHLREIVFQGTQSELYEAGQFVPIGFIGVGAFRDCQYLKRVVLGEDVSTISNSAFENCTRLREIQLPPEIRNIGASAFKNCTRLLEINFFRYSPGDRFVGSGLLLFHTSMRKDVWERNAAQHPEWYQLPQHTIVVYESNGPIISLNTIFMIVQILLSVGIVGAVAGMVIRKNANRKNPNHKNRNFYR